MPIKVGDLPIGAEITIQVDGKPWACTKVNGAGNGALNVIFVMKYSPLLTSHWTVSDEMSYFKSEVHRRLNSEFVFRIEPRVRNALKYYRFYDVFPQKVIDNDLGAIDRFWYEYVDAKVFLLSGNELGITDTDKFWRPIYSDREWPIWPATDSTLAAFISGSSDVANAKRKEILGIPDDMAVWTRSPVGKRWGDAGAIGPDGRYWPYVVRDTDGSGTLYGRRQDISNRHGLNPAFCLHHDFTIPTNTAQITDEDRNLGTFTTTSPSASYTITDPGNFAQTVTEKLNGTVLRTYNAVLGREETATLPADKWLETLNGDYTLTITATDVDGMEVTRTFTFKKAMNTLEFSTKEAIQADEMPIKAILNVQGAMPQGSIFKAEICNNGNDAAPAWEDVTESVKSGEKFFFKNKIKTAEKWGVKVRISLQRGTATGPCYIQSVGGNFD